MRRVRADTLDLVTDEHTGDVDEAPSPAAAHLLTRAELHAGIRAVHGIDPTLDRGLLVVLAAVRLALVLWRNSPIEDIHSVCCARGACIMISATRR